MYLSHTNSLNIRAFTIKDPTGLNHDLMNLNFKNSLLKYNKLLRITFVFSQIFRFYCDWMKSIIKFVEINAELIDFYRDMLFASSKPFCYTKKTLAYFYFQEINFITSQK